MRTLSNDWTQFNREVCQAKVVAVESGRQVFRTTRRLGPKKAEFVVVGERCNPNLRVGDKGDLKIIANGRESLVKFLPYRRGGLCFGN